MKSLRSRLALAVLLGQMVLLGVGTYAALRLGKNALERQFDDALLNQVTTLAAHLEQRGRHVGIELDEDFQREYFDEVDPDYFELFYNGIPFGRSPALDDHDLPHRAGTLEEPAIWDATLPDGQPGRLIGMNAIVPEVEADPETGEVPEAAEVTLILAKSRSELDSLASLFLFGLLLGDALLLLCAVLVMWGTVTVSLRPLHGFVKKVESVDANTLGVPLDPDQVPDEMRPVVTSVNQLLERLDLALRSERRAASNMAHELMTPISELRALSEVALQEPSDPDYRERALGMAHEISLQMANLIRMVRQLTAVDAPGHPIPGEAVPVGPLIERILTVHRERAKDKDLKLDVQVNGEVIHCNRDALLSVFNNLLGNAIEYTPQGGRVELHSAEVDSRVTVKIQNDCKGLTREHLPHITEPFWRLSASRTESDHHGLGLTIAQGMAALAGLTLQFEVQDAAFIATLQSPTLQSQAPGC